MTAVVQDVRSLATPGKARPRILFIIDCLGQVDGGAEHMLLEITRRLPARGIDCSVAALKVTDGSDPGQRFPCPVHVLRLRRTYGWSGLRGAWVLRDLIRSENIELVQTFFVSSDLWGGTIAKLCGLPVVSSRRDMGILRSKVHQVAYRMTARWVDLVLAVSEQVRHYCIRQDGIPPAKALTLYNGVELDRFAARSREGELRSQLGLGAGTPLVVTVSNIRPVKGVDVFIRAAARVHQQFPTAIFLVVGSTFPETMPYFQELKELARTLGLANHLRLLGFRADVVPLLRTCEVYCLLSRSEGFSNSLIEAMACCLPCVATRVGGNQEAIEEGQSGYLVDSEDWEAAAERIVSLLREPRLAQLMGATGRRIVEARFSLDAMMDNLAGVYQRLLDRHRGRQTS